MKSFVMFSRIFVSIFFFLFVIIKSKSVPVGVRSHVGSSWFQIGNEYFSFTDVVGSWSEGKEQCQKMGGSLAFRGVRDPSTYMKIVEHLTPGRSYWINMKDKEDETIWRWGDGEILTPEFYDSQLLEALGSLFQVSTQDDNNDNDCAFISNDHQRSWNDDSCHLGVHYAVCEKNQHTSRGIIAAAEVQTYVQSSNINKKLTKKVVPDEPTASLLVKGGSSNDDSSVTTNVSLHNNVALKMAATASKNKSFLASGTKPFLLTKVPSLETNFHKTQTLSTVSDNEMYSNLSQFSTKQTSIAKFIPKNTPSFPQRQQLTATTYPIDTTGSGPKTTAVDNKISDHFETLGSTIAAYDDKMSSTTQFSSEEMLFSEALFSTSGDKEKPFRNYLSVSAEKYPTEILPKAGIMTAVSLNNVVPKISLPDGISDNLATVQTSEKRLEANDAKTAQYDAERTPNLSEEKSLIYLPPYSSSIHRKTAATTQEISTKFYLAKSAVFSNVMFKKSVPNVGKIYSSNYTGVDYYNSSTGNYGRECNSSSALESTKVFLPILVLNNRSKQNILDMSLMNITGSGDGESRTCCSSPSTAPPQIKPNRASTVNDTTIQLTTNKMDVNPSKSEDLKKVFNITDVALRDLTDDFSDEKGSGSDLLTNSNLANDSLSAHPATQDPNATLLFEKPSFTQETGRSEERFTESFQDFFTSNHSLSISVATTTHLLLPDNNELLEMSGKDLVTYASGVNFANTDQQLEQIQPTSASHFGNDKSTKFIPVSDSLRESKPAIVTSSNENLIYTSASGSGELYTTSEMFSLTTTTSNHQVSSTEETVPSVLTNANPIDLMLDVTQQLTEALFVSTSQPDITNNSSYTETDKTSNVTTLDHATKESTFALDLEMRASTTLPSMRYPDSTNLLHTVSLSPEDENSDEHFYSCDTSPCENGCICETSPYHSKGYHCRNHNQEGYLGKNCSYDPPVVECESDAITIKISSELMTEYEESNQNGIFYLDINYQKHGLLSLNNACIFKIISTSTFYSIKLLPPFINCGTRRFHTADGHLFFNRIWWDRRTQNRALSFVQPVIEISCIYKEDYFSHFTSLSQPLCCDTPPGRSISYGYFVLNSFLYKNLPGLKESSNRSHHVTANSDGVIFYTVGQTIFVVVSLEVGEDIKAHHSPDDEHRSRLLSPEFTRCWFSKYKNNSFVKDSFVELYPSSNRLLLTWGPRNYPNEAHIGFKVMQWTLTPTSLVYLHCQVSIITHNNRKRSLGDEDRASSVIKGPIQILPSKNLKAPSDLHAKGTPSTPMKFHSPLDFLSLTVIIFCVLLICSFICYVIFYKCCRQSSPTQEGDEEPYVNQSSFMLQASALVFAVSVPFL